mmetsp:Transcript_62360/g.167601  ORF Transcript_62360/g.167601 Transcript_62360/m.167601 type:complete len:254 (-) Transcript_62360:70-831(-)
MKSFIFAAACAAAVAVSVDQSGCATQDHDHRALLQSKLAVFDVKCEEMCKKLGAYPECQCPGFQGNPPSAGDTRKCMDSYCQDPSNPCPTDGFITCVSEATKVSALQWDSLLQSFDNSLKLYTNMLQSSKRIGASTASCAQKEHSKLAMLSVKMAVLDVQCEEMCKKLGAYPDCQCPGFQGNPPSAGDTRKCMDSYCQDPSNPCPTDGFITCVSEATKVSALQFGSVFQKLSSGLDMYKNMFAAARNTTSMNR